MVIDKCYLYSILNDVGVCLGGFGRKVFQVEGTLQERVDVVELGVVGVWDVWSKRQKVKFNLKVLLVKESDAVRFVFQKMIREQIERGSVVMGSLFVLYQRFGWEMVKV